MRLLRKQFQHAAVVVFTTFCLFLTVAVSNAEETIKIGVNFQFSGATESLGIDVRKGITLAQKDANKDGGVLIGGKKYNIEVIEYDNKNNKSEASKLVMQSLAKDKVMAVILSSSSDLAIQVAQIAKAYKTPAVATNTTSFKITKNNPYAFRIAAGYSDFAQTTRKLAEKEWKAKKVAILYDELSGYCTTMAKTVKEVFIAAYGEKSVSAFLSFRNGEKTFAKQLQAIIESDAEFLYLPVGPMDASNIIKEARAMGWDKPITGADTWGVPELPNACGKTHCQGLYFTANFAAKGAEGSMKEFSEKYKKEYGEYPSEIAAFGYEALSIIVHSLQNMDKITGSLMTDRNKLRDAISKIKHIGASGTTSYRDNSGEPVKCTLVLKIDNDKEFSRYRTICP